MAASEPKIRGNMLAGLQALLASRQPPVDLADVLEAAGLSRTQQPDAAAELSINAYSRVLEIAARQTQDDCLGLHFAKAFPRGGTRALGFLVLNAPDLRTCLQCLRRYVRLQSDAIDFQLIEKDGIARLTLSFGAALIAPRKQFTEFVLSLIMTRIGSEFGGGCPPLKAEFEYREPRCGGEYELLFGRNTKFDAPESALEVEIEALRKQSPRADQQLFHLLKEIADTELARLDRSQDIVWQVGEYIVTNLAMRQASLEAAAAALDRTPRQLQSDLKRHNTTFEDELSRTRRSLAERYLRDTDLPLSEIALMLGFSELSALTRAARAWLGMPPSQWRQQIRSMQTPKS